MGEQTLNLEEPLSAYCEPFGAAMRPGNAPGTRDSVASCDSDSILVPNPTRDAAPSSDTPLQCSTPKSSQDPPKSTQLQSIPETDAATTRSPPPTLPKPKKLPPPTLPKPVKNRPQPPPKPKKPEPEPEKLINTSFQDETED